MPRLPNETSVLLSDFRRRIDQIVETARREGHDHALNEIRALVGGTGAISAPPVKRGPGRPKGSRNVIRDRTAASKPKKDGRRNSWAGMTPEARLARINSIRKGQGLPPRSA